MTQELLTALYIAASVLFILSLGGLSDQEKAKKAVWYGIIGMIIAIFGTILGPDMKLDKLLIPALVVGSIIGLVVALKVQMTGMPQLVAALHSFVGLAAVFIGINSSIEPPQNLSNVEIVSGLNKEDTVFILPSKSLFDYQKRFKERVQASFSFG